MTSDEFARQARHIAAQHGKNGKHPDPRLFHLAQDDLLWRALEGLGFAEGLDVLKAESPGISVP